jgi:hypothetical protein
MMFQLGVMESPSLRVSMVFLCEAIMIEKEKMLHAYIWLNEHGCIEAFPIQHFVK